jgi:hypothetical protein
MPSINDFLKGNPMSNLKPLLLSVFLLFSAAAQAAPSDDLIRPIQDRWAEIKYRSPAKQQADLYNELSEKVRQISAANPNFPPALIWEGIVVSSEAGARGGLGGLSLASLKLDEKALNGSAYTSLAALYAKVPGWPLGFGDKKKAEELFLKSLNANPDGIDPNYFYGEFLIDQDRVAEGRSYLEKALKAAPRPGRELADQGRRQEVQALLKQIAMASR